MRTYDYSYNIFLKSEADGSVMWVNSFKDWRDGNGIVHVKSVDLASNPIQIPDLDRALAVARKINGKVVRLLQEDLNE